MQPTETIVWPALIREYRLSLSLNIRKFALRYDVSTQAVYLWEKGERQAPYKVTQDVLAWKIGGDRA